MTSPTASSLHKSHPLADLRAPGSSTSVVGYAMSLRPGHVSAARASLLFKKLCQQVMTPLFEQALFEGVDDNALPQPGELRVFVGDDGVPTSGATSAAYDALTSTPALVARSFESLAHRYWALFGHLADDLSTRHAAGAARPDVMRDTTLRRMRGNFGTGFGTAVVRLDLVVGNPGATDVLIDAARKGFKNALPPVALDRHGIAHDPLDAIALKRSGLATETAGRNRAVFTRDLRTGGCCLQFEVVEESLTESAGYSQFGAGRQSLVDAACSVCPTAAPAREAARSTPASLAV